MHVNVDTMTDFLQQVRPIPKSAIDAQSLQVAISLVIVAADFEKSDMAREPFDFVWTLPPQLSHLTLRKKLC
jgi:hypothetical protein